MKHSALRVMVGICLPKKYRNCLPNKYRNHKEDAPLSKEEHEILHLKEQNAMLLTQCEWLKDALDSTNEANEGMEHCILTLDSIVHCDAMLNTEDGRYYKKKDIMEYLKQVGKQPYYDVEKPLRREHLHETRTLGKKIKAWEETIAILRDNIAHNEVLHHDQKNKILQLTKLVFKLEHKQKNYKRRMRKMYEHIQKLHQMNATNV